MPGTGHSARYKGSISNRVRISPFQRLAEWNAQLLGADGAVPTITGGGGSLAFKKLDASDIDGVMTNPASTAGGGNLNMASFGISNIGTLGGVSTINAPLPTLTEFTLNIGPFNADGDTQNISLGNSLGNFGNKSVNIMNFGTYNAFGGVSFLRLGNSTVAGTQISSLATTITGGNTLKLFGNQITIGDNSASTKIGFFGQTPISKPTVAPVTAAGIHTALVSLGLIT